MTYTTTYPDMAEVDNYNWIKQNLSSYQLFQADFKGATYRFYVSERVDGTSNPHKCGFLISEIDDKLQYRVREYELSNLKPLKVTISQVLHERYG